MTWLKTLQSGVTEQSDPLRSVDPPLIEPAGSMRAGPTAAQGWLLAHPRVMQLVNFGMVGGMAFVVDIGVYNILRATILDDKPIGAKVISVAVATVASWLGNRALTFRSTRNSSVVREGMLFALMNVIGLAIAAACLYVSHYLLGFTSQLADNIAGNGIGLILGMAFRFFAYRFIVFRGSSGHSTPAPSTRKSSVRVRVRVRVRRRPAAIATGTARLGELAAGDQIIITLSTGATKKFEVDSALTTPKDAFPTQRVYGPTPTAQLRVVTCDGDFDSTTGHYVDNLVVSASLVS